MLKLALRFACLMLLTSCTVFAQEFSADMVTTSKEGKSHPAKVYVGNNKMRIESAEAQTRGAAIVDFADRTEIIVMSQQHMYMEMPLQQMGQSAFSFWRPDPTDACPGWQKMTESLKDGKRRIASCRKVGNDVVNGRAAIKYEGTSTDGKSGTVWIDPKLRFVLKAQSEDSTFELQNIKEGSQPASLFEVPAGYTKLDRGQFGLPQHPQ